MAVSATRKRSRIRSLWPGWKPGMPAALPPPLDRRTVELHPIEPEGRLPPRSLTANELIAMARTARARRLDP
ncbi:hypothetical protein H0176_13390 [Methylorubrum populi]|jgi:hypothetical protein|nr:hypothetical protein [Methylorubrum sp. DB1722]MBK3406429.1 hypothetical protein [Methylorubrum rhodesianum]MBY0141263.1 hypothetical protein [Methylorubrum populi]MRI55956.1 hypothetical protein [Methylobacterium sp. DB1607]